jgi:hypothetical protein
MKLDCGLAGCKRVRNLIRYFPLRSEVRGKRSRSAILGGGIDRKYVELYVREYVRLDPSSTAHFLAEIGQPIATADYMDHGEFLQTRFYREWALPQQLVDHCSIALDKSATGVAMPGVFRHQCDGLVNDAMRARMRLIAPHVRRAVLIGRAIELKTTQADDLARSLDGLSAGTFLADADGRILHANVVSVAMLNAADFLRSGGGRLAAADGATDQALREAFIGADRGDATIGGLGIAHTMRSQDGEHYVAHVLPLGAPELADALGIGETRGQVSSPAAVRQNRRQPAGRLGQDRRRPHLAPGRLMQ